MGIAVTDLTKVYGQQKAIDSISFNASPGQVLGFLGPNGAGKSTTMKILTGFLPPTSGTALVGGYDVVNNPIEVKRKVGYLPEHNPLYLDMYVKEALEFTAGLYELQHTKRRMDEVIEQTGLGPEQHKKAGQLSKGYRQRLGLALAMLHDPEILILDEPTSGLDPNQLVEIRRLIKELGRDKTVILSTHIMQEAEAVCDAVVIINRGNIILNKTLAELKMDASNQSLEEIFIALTNQ